MPIKAIPKHVSACSRWIEVIGSPPSEFNWDLHYKRGVYADGLVEGVDWVRCLVCAEQGQDFRFKRMMDHLRKVHALDEAGYRSLYPDALVRVAGTAQKRSETVRSRYGVENVFQAEDVKQKSRDTMLVKYGADHPLRVPEIQKRVGETNLLRRGVENPFASPEVQEKIRASNLERFGVENPNQSPEVIARRVETNRERYGVDHYMQTDLFRQSYVETSIREFGVPHPMLSDKGKEAWENGCVKAFGVRNPLSVPEIFRKSYETNLSNHGGQHSQTRPEVLAKARETWLEKYGTDNPSKVEAVKAKIKDVWMGKYGVPFPPQSLWTNREISFPNGFERKVIDLVPAHVVYAGDGSYWVRQAGSSRARNPDFVVLTPEQLKAYLGGADLNTLRTFAVIEAFGDYWHGPERTGKSREAHKEEVLFYYEKCGIRCFILWESELKSHPSRVAERIQRFLSQVCLDLSQA